MRHGRHRLDDTRTAALLERLEAFRRQAGGQPLRVVDLGCGDGFLACAAARLGHRVLGIDQSADATHRAKQLALKGRLNVAFWTADLLAAEQPLSDQNPKARPWERSAEDILGGKPDLVILAYSLHHFEAAEALLARLAAWSPHLRLLINEENPEALSFRLKQRVQSWFHRHGHGHAHAHHHPVHRRPWSEWQGLLEAHGFRIDSLEGQDVLPGLARLSPARCWSLVASATHVIQPKSQP